MAQLVANSLFSASIYAMVGIGFSLIYRCGRFFHFAHAGAVTIGAYSCFFCVKYTALPLLVNVLLGLSFTILLGCLMELVVYRPLRNRKGTPLGFLLVSLGLYIVMQNCISAIFGDNTQVIFPEVRPTVFRLGEASMTSIQLLTLAVSAGVLLFVGSLLRLTSLGKRIRAVASDPELACVVGISVDNVSIWVIAIGSAAAGIAGLLVALDVNLVPNMGMRILLLSVVAVVIGGGGRQPGVGGVCMGALIIGALANFGVWKLPTQWQDPIIFMGLLLFLLTRPEGVFSNTERKV
jgi:branched-chain amino acid transport system permease protein